jgi:hypothetical protein
MSRRRIAISMETTVRAQLGTPIGQPLHTEVALRPMSPLGAMT